MFPSWDSLSELESYQETLGKLGLWGPAILGIVGIAVAVVWAVYNGKVDGRIDELRNEARRKRDSEIQATLDSNTQRLGNIPETAGTLVPGTGPMPESARGFIGTIPETAVCIFLGNNLAWTPDFPFTVFSQGSERMVWVEREESGLLLTAQFFNKEGKIICGIKQNKFTTNPNSVFSIERPNPSTLVVQDDEARQVLEVEYINDRAIRFLGDFYLRGGFKVVITPDQFNFGGRSFIGSTVGMQGGSQGMAAFQAPPAENISRQATDEAESLGDRAWLTPKSTTIDDVVVGANTKATVTLQNIGTKRARNLAVKSLSAVLNSSGFNQEAAIFEQAKDVKTIPEPVEANDSVTLSFLFPAVASEDILKDIEMREKTLHVFMSITYTDATGDPRRTWFSLRYDGPTKMLVLDKRYNGMN